VVALLKTKDAGICLAQFRVTKFAQHRFTRLCVTHNYLREWHFRLNDSFLFYESDLIQVVSSVSETP
jgi:hypothetical protein